jgi:hypothetical protein
VPQRDYAQALMGYNTAALLQRRTCSMTTRLEVESAIKQLPEDEVRDLAKWLQGYLDEMWDRQIEEDLASGKLDHLIAQAEADIANGNVRDLDEVLRNG